MKFTDYCKDKLLLLMLHAFCMLLLAAFLIATAYPVVNCCIILFSWFLILAVWFLTEYFRRKRYFAQIGIILEQADTKFLLGELMPRSFRLEDSFYRDFIRRSNKSVIEKIRAVEDSRQEYREYIESWVHEIKAPIADICLLCEKQKDETARRILEQNRRTENYVDMALFYARSDEVYKDYLIREACLQETAEEVLQKNKYAFIQQSPGPGQLSGQGLYRREMDCFHLKSIGSQCGKIQTGCESTDTDSHAPRRAWRLSACGG